MKDSQKRFAHTLIVGAAIAVVGYLILIPVILFCGRVGYYRQPMQLTPLTLKLSRNAEEIIFPAGVPAFKYSENNIISDKGELIGRIKMQEPGSFAVFCFRDDLYAARLQKRLVFYRIDASPEFVDSIISKNLDSVE